MATRWAITLTAPMASLCVFAQRAIWLRLLPRRASSRVRSRSTSACATVQVRTRPIDRRTRSDSVKPAERALASHSARSASLARTFPKRRVRRSRRAVGVTGVRGGTAPRQPLPGTREAWPQRVGWLTHLKGARQPPGKRAGRPAVAGISGWRSLHTRTRRGPIPTVSTARIEAVSQDFQSRPKC